MRTHTLRTVAGLAAVAALAAAGCGDNGGSSHTASSPAKPVIDPGDGGHYAPHIDPANFVGRVDNPYMPLPPGATWTYDGGTEQDTTVVTAKRREIMGIPAVVVRDTVRVHGEITEDTYDWYAQDRQGNVWYLGEDTKEYEKGKVTSTEGSWEGGVDGALPGIVMPAHPQAGRAYRQEFYPGTAEDMAKVTSVGATLTVGQHRYDDVVVTKEWNPLEPRVVEAKYYAPGVGQILERTLAGGSDRIELTRFEPGG